MKLSDKIIGLRKSNGMSQEDLAEKLDVSRQAISRWESGTAMPDANNILQLSKLFGVTTDYLLNDDYQSDNDLPKVKEVQNDNLGQIMIYLVTLEVMVLLMQFMTTVILQNVFFGFLSFIPFVVAIGGFEYSYQKKASSATEKTKNFRRKFYKISAWLGLYFPIRFIISVAARFYPRPYNTLVLEVTLAMAVMREAAIAAFKPEPFYTVQIGLDGFTASSERYKKKAEAEAASKGCSVVTVTKAERNEKSEKPPSLYDLTSLQRDANRVLGYTAQQTLDYTQNLYEKKLVTYPRTDSRFLTDDMARSLPDIVKLAFHTFPMEGVDNVPVHAEQVVNNKKVTDHHAIIPTRELQKCNLGELPKGELAILQLISNRLCVAVGDPHRYAETVIELDCGGTAFSAKGKTVLHNGWKALVKKNNSTKIDEKEQELPSVSVGDKMTVHETEIKEGKTSPPKHYTEDTLLQSMETAGADEMPDEVERKGLGTPATRAGIIEKLVSIGFLERKGDKKTKHLIPTHKGTALVTVMPEQIQSPSMTADWEEKLLLIEKGEYASEDFMDEIKDVIAGLIQNYEVIRDSEVLMSKKANAIGKCPLCGSAVEDKAKGYFCSNRSCKFALWKNNRYFDSIGKSMTNATAQKLLASGKVKLKGCKSKKTGNTFDATVYMEVSEDGKTSFNMEFDNGGKRK